MLSDDQATSQAAEQMLTNLPKDDTAIRKLQKKSSVAMLGKPFDSFLLEGHNRLRALHDDKIVSDKSNRSDFEFVFFVASILSTVLKFPGLRRQGSAATLQLLLEVVILILNEPKILRFEFAYKIKKRLGNLVSTITNRSDQTSVVVALLQLLGTGSNYFKVQAAKSLAGMAVSLAGQGKLEDADSVVKEVQACLEETPIDGPKFVSVVKTLGHIALNMLAAGSDIVQLGLDV